MSNLNQEVRFLSFEGMHDPLEEDFTAVFQKVPKSGWLVTGNELGHFEQDWAKFLGCRK